MGNAHGYARHTCGRLEGLGRVHSVPCGSRAVFELHANHAITGVGGRGEGDEVHGRIGVDLRVVALGMGVHRTPAGRAGRHVEDAVVAAGEDFRIACGGAAHDARLRQVVGFGSSHDVVVAFPCDTVVCRFEYDAGVAGCILSHSVEHIIRRVADVTEHDVGIVGIVGLSPCGANGDGVARHGCRNQLAIGREAGHATYPVAGRDATDLCVGILHGVPDIERHVLVGCPHGTSVIGHAGQVDTPVGNVELGVEAGTARQSKGKE